MPSLEEQGLCVCGSLTVFHDFSSKVGSCQGAVTGKVYEFPLLPKITLDFSWVSAQGCSQITGRRQISEEIPNCLGKLKGLKG